MPLAVAWCCSIGGEVSDCWMPLENPSGSQLIVSSKHSNSTWWHMLISWPLRAVLHWGPHLLYCCHRSDVQNVVHLILCAPCFWARPQWGDPTEMLMGYYGGWSAQAWIWALTNAFGSQLLRPIVINIQQGYHMLPWRLAVRNLQRSKGRQMGFLNMDKITHSNETSDPTAGCNGEDRRFMNKG